MNEVACVVSPQLGVLDHLIKKQALRVLRAESNALASWVCCTALVSAAFESTVRFLLDDLGVVAWDLSVARDTAQRIARSVRWDC